jgi:hypothetical protein
MKYLIMGTILTIALPIIIIAMLGKNDGFLQNSDGTKFVQHGDDFIIVDDPEQDS